jgi:hypothetical protein
MSGKQDIGIDVVKVILSKAGSDSAFKAKLLAGGNEALAALGIRVPEGVSVKFIEDTAALWHFVIPAPAADGQLTEEELDQVAGGMAPMQVGRFPQIIR